jgi:hypothetical protein
MVLWTPFVWGLDFRPYNTGSGQHEKSELLNYWWRSTSSGHRTFRRFAPAIADAMGLPLECEADYVNLYNTLPSLESFNVAGPQSKMMRWFSWNVQCEMHTVETPALEMLLEHYYGEIENDIVPADENYLSSPHAQLRALRASLSGLKLAHRLSKSRLVQATKAWQSFNTSMI